MSEEHGHIEGLATAEPKAPAAAGRAPDGSPAAVCRGVERALAREPLDRIKCAHLFGDYYRCNWWARVSQVKAGADYDWASTLTDHVRKSRFLRVTLAAEGLRIEEVTARTSGTGAD